MVAPAVKFPSIQRDLGILISYRAGCVKAEGLLEDV